MFVICDDRECEERAVFSMEIPVSLGEYIGVCHVNTFFCQEHFLAHLRTDEWRKVRKLYISEETG